MSLGSVSQGKYFPCNYTDLIYILITSKLLFTESFIIALGNPSFSSNYHVFFIHDF